MADSYIQAGTNASINYGTNGNLIVMNSATNVNAIRKSILKFDVTGQSRIKQAVVRLYVRCTSLIKVDRFVLFNKCLNQLGFLVLFHQ